MADVTAPVWCLVQWEDLKWTGGVDDWHASSKYICILLKDTYSFNTTAQRTHYSYDSHFKAYEVDDESYEQQAMTNLTRVQDDDAWILDADNVQFTGTFSARYAAIVDCVDPEDDSTWLVMAVVDFRQLLTIANGQLSIQWNPSGIIAEAVTPFS